MSVVPKVHIGEVVRNAVVFDLKSAAGDLMDAESLIKTVARFFALLNERHAEYVLVGDIALLQYVEGRNTEDIDLIMTSSSLAELPEIEVTHRDADFARGRFGQLKVDILLTSNPLFDRVSKKYATTHQFVEESIPCATVEGLILLKLYALPSLYRQGNFPRVGLYENDIATLLYAYQTPLDPLFEELTPHLSSSDLVQVKEIGLQAQQRIRRFDSYPSSDRED